MNNKYFLALFIFLLIINSVNAFDLVSVSENEKSVCPSSTILLNANVFGSGSFNINVDGSASKWATVFPQGFSLNNEAKLVYAYITPNFNANPGIYNLNLIASSNNEVKNLDYKINIPDCHNLAISGISTKNICGCSSDKYEFTILNNGIYHESYEVNINGKAAPWIRLSHDSLSLEPSQSKTIYAFLDAPCGSDFGENKFTVTVRSITNNALASYDSNAIVQSCFDFDAKAEKEFVNMCEHSSEIIPLTISNLAELDNEFDLKIAGPAWANLHLTRLNLSSKSSGIINLILSPDYKVEGNFDINIKAKSKQSKIEKEIKFKSSVKKCNDVSLELSKKEDRICLDSKKSYDINIKNTGEFEKDFSLSSTQEWIKPEENILRLMPGESKNIKLNFNPEENLTAKKYEINFKVQALDSSKVNSEALFNLDLISKEQCYKPEMQVQNLNVNADNSGVAQIIIKNAGAETANYELGLSGNANSFSQLNPSTLILEPGKSEIVYLYAAPTYNIKPGEYNAEVSVNVKDLGVLESKTININVNEYNKNLNEDKPDLLAKLISFFKSFQVNQSYNEDIINPNSTEKLNESIKTESSINLGYLKDNLNKYKIAILVGIIIIIFFILLFATDFHKKIIEFFEEEGDDENDEEPLKIGRYFLLIIILIALFWYFRSYTDKLGLLLGYLTIYKFYIIAGLIILIFLILIITYWKDIIDFFEEDIDEKKKKNR